MSVATERRFPRELIGPILLLSASIGGYTLMHVFFFGVPHFTTSTGMGQSEIGYAVSNLAVAGFGFYGLYRGLKQMQKRNH
jgi:hypothetical protein